MSEWKDTRAIANRGERPTVDSVVVTHTDYTVGECAGVRHVLYYDGPTVCRGYMPFYGWGGSVRNGEVVGACESNFRGACQVAQEFYEEERRRVEGLMEAQRKLLAEHKEPTENSGE